MLTATADLQVTPAKNTPCTTQLKQRAASVNGTGLRGRVMASRSQQAPLSKRPTRMKATLPDSSESSTRGKLTQLGSSSERRFSSFQRSESSAAAAHLQELRGTPSDVACRRWDPRAPRGSPASIRSPATLLCWSDQTGREQTGRYRSTQGYRRGEQQPGPTLQQQITHQGALSASRPQILAPGLVLCPAAPETPQ